MTTIPPPAITIRTDPDRLDPDAIHEFLSRSYWAEGRSREVVRRSLQNSLCFGLFVESESGERQIGLARVVTDRATFAYLCDVYVNEEFRGLGLGRRLLESVVAHPDLQGLRRFSLVTRDAHEFYEPFGFRRLAAPEWHMERTSQDTPRRFGGLGEE